MHEFIDLTILAAISQNCIYFKTAYQIFLMTEQFMELPILLVNAFIAQVKPSLKCNKNQSVAAWSILVRNWFSAQDAGEPLPKAGFS